MRFFANEAQNDKEGFLTLKVFSFSFIYEIASLRSQGQKGGAPRNDRVSRGFRLLCTTLKGRTTLIIPALSHRFTL